MKNSTLVGRTIKDGEFIIRRFGKHETNDYKNSEEEKKQLKKRFKYFLAREAQCLDTKKPGISTTLIDALKADDDIPF